MADPRVMVPSYLSRLDGLEELPGKLRTAAVTGHVSLQITPLMALKLARLIEGQPPQPVPSAAAPAEPAPFAWLDDEVRVPLGVVALTGAGAVATLAVLAVVAARAVLP